MACCASWVCVCMFIFAMRFLAVAGNWNLNHRE
jgi:hypothetical protein